MPRQIIGYVRVSTVDQNPERQFIAIRAAIGAEPHRWFTDHSSGGCTDRPALMARLTHVRDQGLIVVAFNRPAHPIGRRPKPARERTDGPRVAIRFLKKALTFPAVGQADPLPSSSFR